MTGLVMKYFVLKPEGDDPYAVASRKAMRAYSLALAGANDELSEELWSWASKEAAAAIGDVI